MVTTGGSATLSGFTLTQPLIDGYHNSNEVAAASLKAQWTFDSTKNKSTSNAVPEKNSGTISYTSGKIGQAISLNQAYMIYPPIANLNGADALPNFTVSM